MTVAIRRLASGDYRTMRWKNGLGETTEIDRSGGAADRLDDFDWRLSLARVEADGPFSVFPGIERTITVVEGAGMELIFADGNRHQLLPLQPFTYDGGMAVAGRLLDGPVRDFNVMVRRAGWRAVCHIARPRRLAGYTVPADIAFAVTLGSPVKVVAQASTGDALRSTLDAGETLRVDGCLELGVIPMGALPAIIVELRRSS